jgi:hypothetical protein
LEALSLWLDLLLSARSTYFALVCIYIGVHVLEARVYGLPQWLLVLMGEVERARGALKVRLLRMDIVRKICAVLMVLRVSFKEVC